MIRQIQYKLTKLFSFPFKAESNSRIKEMHIEIAKRNGLKFNFSKDDSGWVMECENLKGIITGGTNPNPLQDEIDNMVKDAIFTAFQIPPYLCEDKLIKNVTKPAKELEYATN